MILDLPRFVSSERPYWSELEGFLVRREAEPTWRMSVPEIERFHYLYERASADLARLDAFAEPQLRGFLEALVARAYSEIHESRSGGGKPAWRAWPGVFPRAFRRHANAFRLAVAATLAGCLFGAVAMRIDPQAKAVIMPYPDLKGSPAERVAREEKAQADRLHNWRASFSAELMTHNIRVAVLALASGLTWGVGTLMLLFYNGVVLGAVAADYVSAGQGLFLAAWLLPHGAIEVPAILFGGQAGLVLAGALIGWGDRRSRAVRLREASPDLLAIAGGAAALLVWAGVIESFVSQYHQPVLPYDLKIAFGVCELIALSVYLGRVGR